MHNKKNLYILCAAVLCCWTVFRFTAIGAERALYVYNPARVAQEQGLPVDVITVKEQQEILKEPLGISNNKAFVSSERIDRFASGQKVADGVIVSVSKGLDLDTGMHIIRTKNVSDGLHYAEFAGTGFLVPSYAVVDGKVFVMVDGKATSKEVQVLRQDAENALITAGLSDGDKVILSKVQDGIKVRAK